MEEKKNDTSFFAKQLAAAASPIASLSQDRPSG
jgi:hypothetical protein